MTLHEILPYREEPAAYHASDPQAPAVAAAVGALLERSLLARGVTGTRVEHFGSTAVPGLGGKGVIDLLLLYPAGELEIARTAIDELGLQRQTREPWPEERPMRLGAVRWRGRTYRLHVHVVAADSPEVRSVLSFRDQLRSRQDLREAYAARKQEILAAGIDDTIAYSRAKAAFIETRR